ncbi:CooT family nickel-binding protein [Dissulfurirhabdus thermomarina]|uniref:CooT family nickel-binding protein n=1 Tax=Dissulfurirhabdus thermomarina TaxID=1765737 RepID=A0A6N9TR17_DISTH|nr:CooT family nickel-binding protein [Dissulfurirhabdus thermomarina]NDY43518.1 CooT family nickel-binding protein [Dissulfurirhabdus thermomarina]NMX22710.1 CooT family nickel-binding protein [Dissulfurirhabdus thermomarina]
MCQSTVYLRRDGREEELLRDAILVEPCEGGTRIQGLFEGPQVVPARIAVIDLLKHRVVLEPEPAR